MIKKDVMQRTLAKMEESQQKKKEIVEYIKQYKPHLLGSIRKQQRVSECCNHLRFKAYLEGKIRLYKANFCKYDRFCLACSIRRAIRQLKRFEKGLEQYNLQKMKRYHITPTIRHNKDQSLEEVMDNLWKAKKRLSDAYKNSKRDTQKTKSFFSQFEGMIISVEVANAGISGRHPHLHILACSKKEIKTERSKFMGTYANKELQKERYKLSDKLGLNIGIKYISVMNNRYNRKGVGEVFKYAMKFNKLSVPQLVEVIELQQKKQYRFLSTLGICRGWKLEKQSKEGIGDNELEKTYVYDNDCYGLLD